MAGLADAEGHLTRIYRYGVTGELTYGSAAYENEYTYNGESYNPNIHSQYLRARYYCVVTANFLTEDSYLGNINEPLTLNRYNYCISSYPNYADPSGNTYDGYFSPSQVSELQYWLTGDEAYPELAEEQMRFEMEMQYYEASFMAGVVDSVLSNVSKTAIGIGSAAVTVDNVGIDVYNAFFGKIRRCDRLQKFSEDKVDRYLEKQAAKVWDMDNYHTGRCAGDVILIAAEAAMAFKGAVNLASGLKEGIKFSKDASAVLSNGEKVFVSGWTLEVADAMALEGAAAEALAGTLAGGIAFSSIDDAQESLSKVDVNGGNGSNPTPKGNSKKVNVPKTVERQVKKLSPEAKKV